MLDLRLVREHSELVRAAAAKKRVPFDVDRLLAIDREWRESLQEVEQLRATKNRSSKAVSGLDGGERAAALAALHDLDGRLAALEPKARELQHEVETLLLWAPQLPAADVPEGADEAGNVVIRTVGELPAFDFPVRDHLTIAEGQGWLDMSRGAKAGGSRAYFLLGDLVRLEQAVLAFCRDFFVARGYRLMSVPMLVRDQAMVGTGYYPGGEEQAYQAERDGLSLVGTSEVAMMSFHSDETLAEAQLPLLYLGYSGCFRREAGAAGRDTRGVYRVHQFYQYEQIVLCSADAAESDRLHQVILGNAEDFMTALGLPYRVSLMCTGELGRGQARKHDIEAWMPGRGAFCETHSCSTFYDYQCRRLNIRYRGSDGKSRFCHSLNNTAVATPRILIPLLENNQLADGRVRVPAVLRPYIGGDEIIGKALA